METLGVGIVGFGFMGKTHSFAHRNMPYYYHPLNLCGQLKVVCTSREVSARAAAAIGPFERWTTDPLEVIEADDVDLVHICTPNHLHYDALVAAIRAGKHIYVDKPVTASLAEADMVAPLLRDYRSYAQVALQYRFFPATLKAKQLVDKGFCGAVTHFRAAYLHSGSVDPNRAVNWKSTASAGGGVIRDLGSHVLDLLDHLIGPFAAVQCLSRIWSTERPSAVDPTQKVTIDAEEAAIMLLRSVDGAIGCVEASKIATGAQDELRFEIHGRDGAIRFNLMQPNYLEVYDGQLPDGPLGGGQGWQRIDTVHRYPAPGGSFPGPKCTVGWLRAHVHSLYNLLDGIDRKMQPRPSLADGLRLQRIIEAARLSAEQHAWIDLPGSPEPAAPTE